MTSTQLLIRWLIDLAWLSIILVPAILYCRVAINNHKKAWLFFFFGMAIGILALNIGRLARYLLMQVLTTDEYDAYLPVIPIAVGYALVFFAVRQLQEWFYPKSENDDTLDSDLWKKK